MIISLLLVLVVLFSVGTTFAADDDAVAVASDEMAIDEGVLGVEEDADTLSNSTGELPASNVVTNATFHNYFDDTGNLMDTVTDDELVFEGDFTGIDVNYITIGKSIKFTGKDAVFKDVSFVISADNVAIDGFKLSMDNSDMYLVLLGDVSDVTISNNEIDYKSFTGYDSYAIYASAVNNLKLINNTITYVGDTDGTVVNNAIRIECNSTNIVVEDNTFDIVMPSRDVGYDPDTYAAAPYTDGITIIQSENVTFNKNRIKMNYNSYSGYTDTIHVVVLGNGNYEFDDDYNFIYPYTCKNVVAKDNVIIAKGHYYIYGFFIAAENFDISDNTLNLSADTHYAAAFDVEGPSLNGTVADNVAFVEAPNLVYGVYTYQWAGPIEDITYSGNTFIGSAYGACGMEVINTNPVIINNTIVLTGNHTSGIVADMIGYGTISDNAIASLGSNTGTAKTGDGYVHLESTGISVNGDTLISNNEITSTAIGINLVDYGNAGNIIVDGNVINVGAAVDNYANYAIFAKSMDSVVINNNTISFKGKSNGSADSNAISVAGIDDVIISNNNMDVTVTAGKGSAVNLANCPDLIFYDNTINFDYEGHVSWGSNYVVHVDFGCDNANITGNAIYALGSDYVYGINIYSQNFIIEKNNVIVESDVSYACGINPDAGASGVVNNNIVTAVGLGTVYGIYSGMWDSASPLAVDYTNNDVYARGFFGCGIELGGSKENVVGNTITAEGNYTIGVALYKYAQDTIESTITGNTIVSNGVNIGDPSAYWESVGIETTGIKIQSGVVTISDNDVRTTGDYAINLCGSEATGSDNYLAGKKFVGADSIANAENAFFGGSSPDLKTILSAVDLYTVYGSGDVYYAILKDENGDPIKNAVVSLSYGMDIINVTTDDNGVAAFSLDGWDVGSYDVDIKYNGNDTYGPKSIKGHIQIDPRPTKITGRAAVNVLVTAIRTGYLYKFTLTDDQGNPLANQTVTVTFNGKTKTVTTNDLGQVTFKLVASKIGVQKLTVKFDSNPNYVASNLTANVKIIKESLKAVAVNKAYKANLKIKKYTVIIKNSKNKPIKGLRLFLKVNGKTFKAITNAKGIALFKMVKLTKKGNFVGKVIFAGNAFYNKVARNVRIIVR